MVDFYGLKTCDTCKKARKALDGAGVRYDFHDVRDDGVTQAQISRWAAQVGVETLLNKNSTTWRALDDEDRADLSPSKAIALMAEHPTLIRRPIIVRGGTEVYVGWSEDVEEAMKE